MPNKRGPLPEVCRILAGELASECASQNAEQVRFLTVGRKSNQKYIVLVTTTDRATEALLEFLDGQRESGEVECQREWAGFDAPPEGTV